MSVNQVTNDSRTYDTKSAAGAKTSQGQPADGTQQKTTESNAAVYEKSDAEASSKKTYQRDSKTIDRLLEESEKRTRQLRELVQKMLMKQGRTYTDATDIYAELREGKLEVDPEVSEQAKKDIAQDGYWGVEQTSERLVSFAKALTGGDTSKADEMINAVKKGFDAAMKAWGGDLPEISKQTMDAAVKKLEAWRDGKDSDSK